MSILFCDTNCEISYEKAEALNLHVIQMPYTVNDDMYFYDLGKNTDIVAFFNSMRGGAVVKTQALNASEYVNYFEPIFQQGEDILYITFSQKMSGTFNALTMALEELKEKYPERKVTIVDSGSISMGAGKVVEFAAKYKNTGATDEEVVAFVENFKQKTKIYFTVADLKYLVRGGRLSSFEGAVGSILQIKPIITVVDGKITTASKVNGRKKSLHALVEKLSSENVDLEYPITVLDADCEQDSQLLIKMIKDKYPDAVLEIAKIGPVIGTHCGPDTMGIIFVAK